MKKLQLKKETLKVLADETLDQVRGGAVGTPEAVACCAYSATAIKSCNGSVSCPVAEPIPAPAPIPSEP